VTSFKFEISTSLTYIIACESWRFVSLLKKGVRNEISKLHNWDQLHHNRYIDTDSKKSRNQKFIPIYDIPDESRHDCFFFIPLQIKRKGIFTNAATDSFILSHHKWGQ